MSLSDLASLGSLASGIAVVVTLLFLLLQLRQANLNQKSLMQQGRSLRTIDLLTRFTDPNLAAIVLRAFRADPALTDEERFVFYGYAAALIWNYEDSFLQHEAGTLDARSWESDVSTLERLLRNPAYRAAWRAARESIGSGFRAFVDQLIERIPPASSRNAGSLFGQYLAEEAAAAQTRARS
jgi:hypothetical protein